MGAQGFSKMSDTRKVRLWFVRDTPSGKARIYTRIPLERSPQKDDEVCVPLSLIEHTTKRGAEHVVTLPEWFCDKVIL